jgi:putative flippase GtrA
VSVCAIAGNTKVKKLAVFLAAGLFNTLFGFAVYALLVYLDTPYLLALFLSTVVGVVFNYFSYGAMVFGAKADWKVFSKFVIAYALSYASNAALLHVLTANHQLNAYLAQGMCIVPIVGLSWLLLNNWVYKGNPTNDQ